MSSSSTSSTPSTPSIIPPIITNEKDRYFLKNLNNFIEDELGQIDPHNPEQRYVVFKAAFDRVIDYVTAYKPLLTSIKAEYEDCIETIQRGQQEAFYLAGKLKAMAYEPTTIRNYKKRGDELEQKMDIIRKDNERLQKQLDSLCIAREEREREAREKAEPPKHTVKKDNRHIPGLTVNQSTDLKTLSRELEKLEKQLRELSISHRTRYAPKHQKESLKDQLSQKVTLRDQLLEKTELQKLKRQKLKVAVEAAQAYMKIQPPHQTIGDAVVMALARASSQLHAERAAGEDGIPPGTSSQSTFEEDDPTREKEAEMMLEYIEKFNELLEDTRYEEAAIHAANSPKGILRTPETLHRFKGLRVPTSSGRSPLLAYCDALMSTVLAYGVRPSEYMSLECVRCVLDENRIDLLSHWMAQDRLTMTEQLGNMIFEYCQKNDQWSHQCLALAQKVYTAVGSHLLAAFCMVRQGRVNQALSYGHQTAKFTSTDYCALLTKCPGPQLARTMYRHRNNGLSPLPLGTIVRTLLATDSFDVGLHLLHEIYLEGPVREPQSERNPIWQGVFDDQETSQEQWLDIVMRCQECGYGEAGLEVLAAVTVCGAMRGAAERAGVISKSSPGENEKNDVKLQANHSPKAGTLSERRKGRRHRLRKKKVKDGDIDDLESDSDAVYGIVTDTESDSDSA